METNATPVLAHWVDILLVVPRRRADVPLRRRRGRVADGSYLRSGADESWRARRKRGVFGGGRGGVTSRARLGGGCGRVARWRRRCRSQRWAAGLCPRPRRRRSPRAGAGSLATRGRRLRFAGGAGGARGGQGAGADNRQAFTIRWSGAPQVERVSGGGRRPLWWRGGGGRATGSHGRFRGGLSVRLRLADAPGVEAPARHLDPRRCLFAGSRRRRQASGRGARVGGLRSLRWPRRRVLGWRRGGGTGVGC